MNNNTFVFSVKTTEKGFMHLFDMLSKKAGCFAGADTTLCLEGMKFSVLEADRRGHSFRIGTFNQKEPTLGAITEFLKGTGEKFEVSYKQLLLNGEVVFTSDPLKAGEFRVSVPKHGYFVPKRLWNLDGQDIGRKELKTLLQQVLGRSKEPRLEALISKASSTFGVSFMEYRYAPVRG